MSVYHLIEKKHIVENKKTFKMRFKITLGILSIFCFMQLNTQNLFAETESTTADATLAKHGGGSSRQTIDFGDAIDEFYFNWENADSVTITGMPEGIDIVVTMSDQKIAFSGTPADTGYFAWTLSTTGADVNASYSGYIDVEPVEEDTSTTTYKAPAFPGAEGFGRYTTGGRGGQVIYVTNLNDDGTGSLRDAVETKGARIIMFKVSGIIELESNLTITNDDLTIAGQSAPGDGICIKNYNVNVNADNIIIRYLRFRMGDELKTEDDALGGRYHENIIVDHCSMSWSTDECVSFYNNENFSLQWCIMAESLRNSVHDKGKHGYGGIWGGVRASFHHNLLAHHDSRNPRFCGSRFNNAVADSELCDLRNNVIYAWGGNSGYGAEGGSYNIVNNYYKPGDCTESGVKDRIYSPNDESSEDDTQELGIHGYFYVNGNYMNESTSVTSDNWKGIDVNFKYSSDTKSDIKSDTEYDCGDITTQSAADAYSAVLNYAGASLVRDTVDARIVYETQTGTYTYTGSNGSTGGLIDSQSDVGGWPDYTYDASDVPTDTDGDGMPDDWETANGLDSSDDSDGITYTLSDLYTNVEVYLNSLVEAITDVQNENGTANYAENDSTAVLIKMGVGDANQSIELGDAITDFYYSWVNATSATTNSSMPYGVLVSLDTDEQTISFSGTPQFAGIYNYTVVTEGAAINDTATGTITVTAPEDDDDDTVDDTDSTETNLVSGVNIGEPSIYPNPMSNGELTLELSDVSSNTMVNIYNIVGTLIYSNDQVTELKTTIKLDITAGNYFVKITSGDNIYMKKLIVN